MRMALFFVLSFCLALDDCRNLSSKQSTRSSSASTRSRTNRVILRGKERERERRKEKRSAYLGHHLSFLSGATRKQTAWPSIRRDSLLKLTKSKRRKKKTTRRDVRMCLKQLHSSSSQQADTARSLIQHPSSAGITFWMKRGSVLS